MARTVICADDNASQNLGARLRLPVLLRSPYVYRLLVLLVLVVVSLPVANRVTAHSLQSSISPTHAAQPTSIRPADSSCQQSTVAPGLSYPEGVAVDGSGTVYVADTGDSRVVKVAPNGTQSIVPATGLVDPIGVAVDGAGNVYIADSYNNRVVEVTSAGVQSTVPATGLSFPESLAVDGAGNIYIADTNNNRVVKMTPSGTQSTVPATGLSGPQGVAVDGSGNVYIADTFNNQVVKVTSAGVQSIVPATGLSYPQGVAVDSNDNVYIVASGDVVKVAPDGTQSTVPATGLVNPFGVAVDGNSNVYIADTDNSRVVKVTPDGTQSNVPAMGLSSPQGVTADGSDNVYIADTYNNRVVKVTSAGVQSTVPATGLSAPFGVAVDGSGNVYIADYGNNRVVKVTPSGTQSTVPAIGLSFPQGVAVDGSGNVYIADSDNNRVVKVTPAGVQSTVPATGLDYPSGVAVDGSGNVYIADTYNNRVAEVAPDGIQSTVGTGLSRPHGVAVDGNDNVYIDDFANSRVVEVTPSGTQSTVPATGLHFPSGVAVDDSGNIYIVTGGDVVKVACGAPSLSVSIDEVDDSRNGMLYFNSGSNPLETGNSTVDGNQLTVKVGITNPSASSVAGAVTISLSPSGASQTQSVTVPPNSIDYQVSVPVPTDGLGWDTRSTPAARVTTLYLNASFDGVAAPIAADVPIVPRPVVLVHGLNTDDTTWQDWYKPCTGPTDPNGGFLCKYGYPSSDIGQVGLGTHYGYPVNTMNTKQTPTNTTAENASALAQYIEMVRNTQGADKVDLVAHSMGGLISRYYIANDMPGRVVTRLIMLGTPNTGSEFAVAGSLPTCPKYCPQLSAWSPQPATYENTPEFVQDNTDQQATARQGAHYFAIGGDIPITSLCPSGDGWPSDLIVNHDSVRTVSIDSPTYVGLEQLSTPVEYQDMPVTHVESSCQAATDHAETESSQVFLSVFDTMLSNPSMATSRAESAPATALTAATRAEASDPLTATSPLTTSIMAAQVVSLTAGQSMSLTAQASNLSDLTALVAVNVGPTDTRPVLTLTAPDGSVSTANSLQTGVGYADNSYDGPLPFLAFSAQNPQDGTWTLTVTNPATSTVSELPVVATFMTDSATGLALSAGTDQSTYLPGQSVALTATLTQVNADGSTQPIGADTGATATAQLSSLLDPAFTPQTLTLYDDGQHGDGAANDGVYGASFSAPSQTGQYQLAVTAVGAGSERTAQEPLQVQVANPPPVPAIYLSPNAAASGTMVGITSTSCFSPDEQVAITMSTGLLDTAQADATGALSVTEIVPPGLSGEVPVTATGQSSGVSATAPFGVLPPAPAVALSRASGGYKAAIAITGTNFAPAEAIGVYWDTTSTAPLSQVTSLADGSFHATIAVPQASLGTHLLVAVGQSSGKLALASFQVTPLVTLTRSSGAQGTQNTLKGFGFGAQESVAAYWNPGMIPLGSITSTISGTVQISITIPLSPTGQYQVKGIGQSTQAAALSSFKIVPTLAISPSSGARGSHATVTGTGYKARDVVTARWNCPSSTCSSTTVLGKATANTSGDFTLQVTIPTTTTIGAHAVGGLGRSGAFAASTYHVTS